jgi:hypothetical protein
MQIKLKKEGNFKFSETFPFISLGLFFSIQPSIGFLKSILLRDPAFNPGAVDYANLIRLLQTLHKTVAYPHFGNK